MRFNRCKYILFEHNCSFKSNLKSLRKSQFTLLESQRLTPNSLLKQHIIICLPTLFSLTYNWSITSDTLYV